MDGVLDKQDFILLFIFILLVIETALLHPALKHSNRNGINHAQLRN